MNGKKGKVEEAKPWDLPNWGLNKENIQQSQEAISKQHATLSNDTIENQTQKGVTTKDDNDKEYY